MKRLVCYQAPSLDDLLAIAVAVDEGRLALDPDNVRSLLSRLASIAEGKLSRSSALRLGSASVEKDWAGFVTVRLNRRGLTWRSGGPASAA